MSTLNMSHCVEEREAQNEEEAGTAEADPFAYTLIAPWSVGLWSSHVHHHVGSKEETSNQSSQVSVNINSWETGGYVVGL